ncbi:MAG: FkbM family methyltransferase [Myxococcota bacterium]|nr:FkbM family methyltransferase [Myxococcota bacterium]
MTGRSDDRQAGEPAARGTTHPDGRQRRLAALPDGPVREALRLPVRAAFALRRRVRSGFRASRRFVRRLRKDVFSIRAAVLAFPFWDGLARLQVSETTLGRVFQRGIAPRIWRIVADAARRPETRTPLWPFIYAYGYGIHLQKGSTFIQVGASQGQDTERISTAVGPEGLILAIEPVPENYARLIERIEDRALSNVRPRHIGASDRAGKVRFLLGGPKQHVAVPGGETISWTTGSKEEFLDPDLREEFLEVDTLDSILGGHSFGEGHVHAMLETNGSELDVLHGMEKTLEAVDDIVVAGAAVLKDGQPVVDAMIRFLEQRGFDTHCMGEERAADRHDRLVGIRRR